MTDQDKIKDLEKRIKSLQEAITEDPDNKAAYEEEIEDYQRRLDSLKPRETEYSFEQRAKTATLDERISYYERAIKSGLVATCLAASRLYANLAVAYNEKGEHDKAINCCEKAIEFNSENYLPHQVLGRIYLTHKDNLDKAIEHLEKAINLNKNNEPSNSVDLLGSAYKRKGEFNKANGNYDQAIEYYKKALNLNPNDWCAHDLLGSVYSRKGQHDKAREQLEKRDRTRRL